MKEVKAYQTTDGFIFPEKEEAENHQKTIDNFVQRKKEFLEEIKQEVKKAKENKKTIYVVPGLREKVIATEKGPEFTDPLLHVKIEEFPWDEYEVLKVEESELVRKVYYKKKYSMSEVVELKLKADEEILKKTKVSIPGELLTEAEIELMCFFSPTVYEEEEERGKWYTPKTTVVKANGKLYAIEWEEGLTENQEDWFNWFNVPPYEVTLETETELITVTNTIINKVEWKQY